MYPQIFLDGPGADTAGAGLAVLDLHRKLLACFRTQKALDDAYIDALSEIELDDEWYPRKRPPTRFEQVFDELAGSVHAFHRLPERARFFFEIPL